MFLTLSFLIIIYIKVKGAKQIRKNAGIIVKKIIEAKEGFYWNGY